VKGCIVGVKLACLRISKTYPSEPRITFVKPNVLIIPSESFVTKPGLIPA
jgi:hypothetical protein